MPDTYSELLDATIQHLESLKARGTKFVSVSHETLAALDRPAVKRGLPNPGTKVQTSDLRETSGPRSQPKPTAEVMNIIAPPPPPTTLGSTAPTGATNAAKEAAFADL